MIKTDHRQRMREMGVTAHDMARKTGMTEAGVFKCLRQHRMPFNILARRAWCSLLHVDQATGEPLP